MTDKLHVDAVLAAAHRMTELQAENKHLRGLLDGSREEVATRSIVESELRTTIDELRATLANHNLLFGHALGTNHFLELLLDGLAHQLPDGTPRTVEGIVDAVAKMYLALDAHEDASTPAFDEIAKLCGVPEWEYPGQVVRDVEGVVQQQAALRDKLRIAEAIRADACAASQRYLDEKRTAEIANEHYAALLASQEKRVVQLQRMLDTREQLRAGRPTNDDMAEVMAQKNAAYAERDRCVAGLAAMAVRLGWSAWLGKHVGDPWDHDWRWIVFINLPTGQVSWHVHDDEVEWFSFLPEIPERTWDGHDTEQKYERLAKLGHDATLKIEDFIARCGCSEKYVELAPGVHAKYCPLAGLPLEVSNG